MLAFTSKTKLTEFRVVLGTSVVGGLPMKFAIFFFNRHTIDRRVALLHQAMLIEEPVFIAMSSKPVTLIVVILITEAHHNEIIGEAPKFLDQAIGLFSIPLALKEGLHFISSFEKSVAVSPGSIRAVGLFHLIGGF